MVKIRTSVLLLCLAACVVLGGATDARGATIYAGSLTSASGLNGSGQWADSLVLSWSVSDVTNPGFWTYSYTFSDVDPTTNQRRVIDNVLIEVSSDFSLASDFLGFSGGATVTLDTFVGGNPSPFGSDFNSIPSAFRALRFDTTSTTATSYAFSFYSPRAPVWGDFFATDSGSRVFNSGFGNPDTDPSTAPANGSVSFHLLVPDTAVSTQPEIVPEPATVLLLGAGLAGVAARRRAPRRSS